MIAGRIALLLGLFIAPAVLLYLAHSLRDFSEKLKRRFWGAVYGHIAGMLVATVAMLAPPIWWSGGSPLRDVTVHWSMLVGSIAGFLIAPLLATRSR